MSEAESGGVEIITPGQLKAARSLLDWPQRELASRVKVSLNTIAYIETGRKTARSSTLRRIESAFETAGIEFISEGDGLAAVRLKEKSPSA